MPQMRRATSPSGGAAAARKATSASRLASVKNAFAVASSIAISGNAAANFAKIGTAISSSVSGKVTRTSPRGKRSRPASWRSSVARSSSTRPAVAIANSPAAVGA